jgi:mannose-6-phosphate isomerase-like protein (cupin superfamily)
MVKKAELRAIPSVENALGSIGVLEDPSLVPFSVERVYFIYDVPEGSERGSHAHKHLEQFMVAASGSFTVELDSGLSKVSFVLDSPSVGLYVPPGMWRDLKSFAPNSVCLVLASTKYDESDYLRDYDEFLSWAGKNS